MLRHPHVSMANLIDVFPDLTKADPVITARIDIEGAASAYTSARALYLKR
jgi:hypothetical protein